MATPRTRVAVTDQLNTRGVRHITLGKVVVEDVSDDQAPFEFSVAFGGGEPEIRVLLEAQGDPPDLRSNQAAARALLRHQRRTAPRASGRARHLASRAPPAQCLSSTFWPGVGISFSSTLLSNLACSSTRLDATGVFMRAAGWRISGSTWRRAIARTSAG